MSRPFALLAFLILLLAQPGQAQTHLIRLAVPMTWQMTHTHITGPTTPSLTESFREMWHLEVAPSGLLLLASPRAQVRAYPIGNGESHELVPRRVAVTEWDFARLVGVQPLAFYEPDEAEAMGMFSKPVFLYLGGAIRGGTDVDLMWSDDDNYSVHLESGAEGSY